MVNHTIKAHMEVAASASMGKRRKPDVIAEIIAASRNVDQMKCANAHERFAQRVVAAIAIVMNAARAQVEPTAPEETKPIAPEEIKSPSETWG